MLYILFMSGSLGMASKALLMSIVVSIVRFAGLLALTPSCMFCVMFVSSVFVE